MHDLPTNQDINAIGVVKGEHTYVILCSDARRGDALRVLGRWASDPQLNFSWHDAAKLSQVIRTGTSKGVDHVSAVAQKPRTDSDRQ